MFFYPPFAKRKNSFSELPACGCVPWMYVGVYQRVYRRTFSLFLQYRPGLSPQTTQANTKNKNQHGTIPLATPHLF